MVEYMEAIAKRGEELARVKFEDAFAEIAEKRNSPTEGL